MLKEIIPALNNYTLQLLNSLESEINSLTRTNSKKSLAFKKNIIQLLNKLVSISAILNTLNKEHNEAELPSIFNNADKEIIERFIKQHHDVSFIFKT